MFLILSNTICLHRDVIDRIVLTAMVSIYHLAVNFAMLNMDLSCFENGVDSD